MKSKRGFSLIKRLGSASFSLPIYKALGLKSSELSEVQKDKLPSLASDVWHISLTS